jgi:hypothetical protein
LNKISTRDNAQSSTANITYYETTADAGFAYQNGVANSITLTPVNSNKYRVLNYTLVPVYNDTQVTASNGPGNRGKFNITNNGNVVDVHVNDIDIDPNNQSATAPGGDRYTFQVYANCLPL